MQYNSSEGAVEHRKNDSYVHEDLLLQRVLKMTIDLPNFQSEIMKATATIQSKFTNIPTELNEKVSKLEKDIGSLQRSTQMHDSEYRSCQQEISELKDTASGICCDVTKSTDRISILEEFLKRQDHQSEPSRIITSLQQTILQQQVEMNKMRNIIDDLQKTSYDGILLWKITDFSIKQIDAQTGRVKSIYSPFFFTSPRGYKIRARVYPNGDGVALNNHLSLFLSICHGDNDAVLPWPFRQKVTFQLIDQDNREHVIDSFRPDVNSSSFKRPTSESNVATGFPMFVPFHLLEARRHSYIKDDTMFIKITVDRSGIE